MYECCNGVNCPLKLGRTLSSHANVAYVVLNLISVLHKALQMASDFACQLASLLGQCKRFILEG